MITRRIISVWFPEFPVQRFLRARRKQGRPCPPRGLPFALVEKGQKGLRLYAVNMVARQFGLTAGQRLADARAAVPDLLTEPHAPDKDTESLLGLVHWMERYSPWVAPDGKDGLLLEATGVSHLFGGEQAMQASLRQRLEDYGFTTQTACAATIGAAWALARFGKEGTSSVAPRQLLQRRSADNAKPLSSGEGGPRASVVGEVPSHPIEALPIEALRIDATAARTLRRLGLKTIGSLMDLPRASLARRFRGEAIHENVLLRLDELTGARHEALNAINPPSSFIAHRALMEPVISHEGLQAVLSGLVTALAQDLAAQGQGAMRLILKLFRSDGSRVQVPAGLSAPSHSAAHMQRLLLPKLEEVDAGFGIDAMTLEARESAAIQPRQHGFMEEDADTSLDELNDRVLNRHDQGLVQLQAVASHVPERAERDRDLISRASGAPASPKEKRKRAHPSPLGKVDRGASRETDEVPSPRPLLIFETPEPARVIAAVPDGPPMRLTWRRVTRKIVRSQGPERIAPEWWQLTEGERPRDYYHVEDEEGRRYWLYRDGLYGEDDSTPPKWFVHGLSA